MKKCSGRILVSEDTEECRRLDEDYACIISLQKSTQSRVKGKHATGIHRHQREGIMYSPSITQPIRPLARSSI
jgi:hypothetical protein